MHALKQLLPTSFQFTCKLPVRITDINYGGHVGNDRLLVYAHEARIQYLQEMGYTEMELDTTSLMLTKASLEIRSELFFGDQLSVAVQAMHFTSKGFDLLYKIEKITSGKPVLAAIVLTTMICFDYKNKKVTSLPETALQRLSR
ncbi:MAG: thioesterase family protein [Bacteroidetes bacterium]|nr:thioesterase family protein [Bacteroidota bacterium]